MKMLYRLIKLPKLHATYPLNSEHHKVREKFVLLTVLNGIKLNFKPDATKSEFRLKFAPLIHCICVQLL